MAKLALTRRAESLEGPRATLEHLLSIRETDQPDQKLMPKGFAGNGTLGMNR